MNRLNDLISAINYIELNVTTDVTVQSVCQNAYSSPYHFQRIFGITFGVTIGEYIRNRKLTLAGVDLLKGNATVTEIAFKYGYETVESFSRAFKKFHNILPSKVKSGSKLNFYEKINVSLNKGSKIMNYSIEEHAKKVLVGYKKRFHGVPYGEERAKQEEEFITSTRAKQWLLIGASCDYTTDYFIITNVDDNGYDFYVAYDLDDWTKTALYDTAVTGVDFIKNLGFEEIVIPTQTYLVFKTEKKKRPVIDYIELRSKIANSFLPSSNYEIVNSPEVTVMHWRPNGEWEKERYIEIRLPICKAKK